MNLFTPAISSAISPNNAHETKKHSQIAIKLNQKPSTCIKSGQKRYIPPSNNKNNVLNVPLSAGTKSHEFLNAYESIFKKLKTFRPEFILLSAGFDAHKDDPLAQINLETEDYYTFTKRISILAQKLCSGKIVSILEGGYDLNALKESVKAHVNALLESNK